MIPGMCQSQVRYEEEIPYLSVPEMRGKVVTPLAKLESDDFVHN